MVAAVAPDAVGAQVAVAAATTGAGIWLVRPYVSAVYERRHHLPHVARGVHGGIVGQQAVTLDEVADAHARGHVQFVGETWLAVADDGLRIAAGTDVLVTRVEGTTLVVAPVET